MDLNKPFGDEIKSGTSDSILASIFRNILMDLGITATRFDKLLARYISNSLIPVNIKESSSRRGNLKKELMKSSMSWKVFIKGLVFLNVKKFEISIRIFHDSDYITDHKRTIVLTNFQDLEDDDDE